jgi:cytidine deaminase
MAKISSISLPPKKGTAKALIKAVRKALKTAYAPYSKIAVGAALYCANGDIYTAGNIENCSYSLTMCAERIALFKAISEGSKDFQLLLVYSPQIDYIMPCGACLQVLKEFAPDIVIATMNKHNEFHFYPLKTLLANPFCIESEVSDLRRE